jgi:hypothetical protein
MGVSGQLWSCGAAAVRAGHEPSLINLVLAKQTVLNTEAHNAKQLSHIFFFVSILAASVAAQYRVVLNGAAGHAPDIAYTSQGVRCPPICPPKRDNIPNVLQCDCLPRD